MPSYYELSLSNAVEKIQNSELSAVELAHHFLDEVKNKNSRTNSFITILDKEATTAASIIDSMPEKKRRRFPLCGAPIAIKDLFDIQGTVTTCGSLSRKDSPPATKNSAVVQQLQNAGAIILGKLNLHEFALGATSENQAFGNVMNPWNAEFIAGGSSGGSAAAVADGLCLGSIGTDTGGSVRIPASLCGVVGLKPTAGLVDLEGVFPLSRSLDNAGPLAGNVTDCELLFRVMTGPNSRGASIVDFGKSIEDRKTGVSGFSVGVMENLPVPVNEEVDGSFEKAVSLTNGLVSSVRHIKIPFADYYKPISDLIMLSEAFSVHEELLKRSFEKYSKEVRTRMLSGDFFSAVEYIKAKELQTFLRRSLKKALVNFDLLILPTTPTPATKIGQSMVSVGAESNPFEVKQILPIFTRPLSLTGFPALSLPCGFTKSGLPIGLQIVAKPFGENIILAFARALEQKLSLRRKPSNPSVGL
jgi:aspartyl-tRNA(Asn)/glutamyl-tRNA(Gln) amidotransferase subunit A